MRRRWDNGTNHKEVLNLGWHRARRIYSLQTLRVVECDDCREKREAETDSSGHHRTILTGWNSADLYSTVHTDVHSSRIYSTGLVPVSNAAVSRVSAVSSIPSGSESTTARRMPVSDWTKPDCCKKQASWSRN